MLFGLESDDTKGSEIHHKHDIDLMNCWAAKTIRQRKQRNALMYMMFLKNKLDGSLKQRGYAEGRKQRISIPRSDTSIQTISTKAVFSATTIATQKVRRLPK